MDHGYAVLLCCIPSCQLKLTGALVQKKASSKQDADVQDLPALGAGASDLH